MYCIRNKTKLLEICPSFAPLASNPTNFLKFASMYLFCFHHYFILFPSKQATIPFHNQKSVNFTQKPVSYHEIEAFFSTCITLHHNHTYATTVLQFTKNPHKNTSHSQNDETYSNLSKQSSFQTPSTPSSP